MYSLQQQYASLGKRISHFIVHSYFSSVLKFKSAKLMKLEMSTKKKKKKKKKNLWRYCGGRPNSQGLNNGSYMDIAVSFIFRRNYGIYFFLTKIKKNILMDMKCASVGTKNKIYQIYIYITLKVDV